MRLLLEHGAEAVVHYDFAGLLLHEASFTGRADIVHVDARTSQTRPRCIMHRCWDG